MLRPGFSLFAALALSACARDTRVAVVDLVREAPLADHQSAWDVVLFGTPRAEPAQVRGFIRTPSSKGDSFALAQREVEIGLTWAAVSPRVALLDAAPAPGLTAQAVSVFLNDRSLGRLELAEGRRRYALALPAEAQRAGANAVVFRFERAAPAPAGAGRAAAIFYSLTIGSDGDRALQALQAKDAPPPVSIASEGELVQIGPSLLMYAFRLPEETELRFTPSLHAASQGAAHLRVGLEDASGEREVWSGRAAAGERPREVRAALPGRVGDIVRLTLRVEPSGPGGAAWASWGTLRLFGRAPETPRSSDAERQVDVLRRSTAGASVLLVVLDAAGARHFHCYGYPRETTPEIDRLAAEGVLFERAFTPAVFTLAAMSSVWTGLPSDRSHRGVAYDAPLPEGPATLAERLSAAGIHTAGFVANGMAGASFGLHRGFAEFHEVYRERGHRASAFLEVLPAFFRANKDRRFFAYAHLREPHFPYDPEPPFHTRFGPDGPLGAGERGFAAWYTAVNARKIQPTPQQADHLVRLYDGNLASADAVVGALRRSLEEQGLWDRTAVIVTADHGEALLEHGFISHGQQLYDESTWIPLVARLPGGPRGARVKSFVDLTGLAPTVADLLGLPGRDGSLLPLLFGAPGADAAFSRTVGEKPQYSVRDERYRFLFNTRYGQEELYDLQADPAEQLDVVAQRPVVAAYYRQRLAQWIRALERGTPRDAPSPPLSKEALENLKALGYVR